MKRTTVQKLAAVGCTAVMALSFAGCGSDKSDSPGSSPSTLSDTDFKTQANALCKAGFADASAIQQASTEATQDADFGKFLDRLEKVVTDIKALPAPSDLSSGVNDMLDSVSSVLSTARTEGVSKFGSDGNDPFADANAKATAIGLTDCAGS